MTNNDEVKPIEEIKEQSEPPKEAPLEVSFKPTEPAKTEESSKAPEPPTSSPAPTEPKPLAAPIPVPQAPGEPGKKAVIKRTGGEGGWLKYLLIALVVLLIGAGVFYYFFYRATIVINPSPTPDKILLDNSEVKPGTYRVKPGVHTILIQKTGYISYISSNKYSIGQKINLNFKFEAEKAPTLSVQGGRFPIFSSDKKYMFFLDKDSAISVLDLNNAQAKQSVLSNAKYPTTKILKISKDKNFALLLDDEAINVISFNRTDLINQSEIKLPPLASAISALTWNNNESDYFEKANSKILYDMQTTYGWDVFLSNLSHDQASIILQLDSNLFQNLQLDWAESPNKVLVIGGEIGILDVSNRDYNKIETDKKFIWGKWGPEGDSAVAIDNEGGVWVYQNSVLEKLPFTSKANQVDYIDKDNIAAISSGQPVKYNLQTKVLESFAEVKELSNSFSFISRDDVFYFETKNGIFSGRFEKPQYQ
jgi:hypothetical protein